MIRKNREFPKFLKGCTPNSFNSFLQMMIPFVHSDLKFPILSFLTCVKHSDLKCHNKFIYMYTLQIQELHVFFEGISLLFFVDSENGKRDTCIPICIGVSRLTFSRTINNERAKLLIEPYCFTLKLEENMEWFLLFFPPKLKSKL